MAAVKRRVVVNWHCYSPCSIQASLEKIKMGYFSSSFSTGGIAYVAGCLQKLLFPLAFLSLNMYLSQRCFSLHLKHLHWKVASIAGFKWQD